VCFGGSLGLDDLNAQLDQIGPTRGGAQVGVLRFTIEIVV